MASTPQGRMSFGDTLTRIEQLEEVIKKALAPARGWEWWRTPSDHLRGTDGRSHVLTLGWPPQSDGDPWTPCLGVYLMQGGGGDDIPVERRAVAFDRQGRRHVLEDCVEGAAEHADSGGWVEAKMYKLPPETLPLADVAYVGIEARRQG